MLKEIEDNGYSDLVFLLMFVGLIMNEFTKLYCIDTPV